MDTLIKTAPFDSRSVRTVGEVAHFRGRLLSWGAPDAFGDSIAAGAVKGTADGIPLLWQGSSDNVVGHVPRVTSDKAGLLVDAEIVLGTQRGKEAASLIRSGAIRHLGACLTILPGGASYSSGVRTITRAELVAVSLSTFPQQDDAQIMEMRHRSRIEYVDLDMVAEVRREVANWRRLAGML